MFNWLVISDDKYIEGDQVHYIAAEETVCTEGPTLAIIIGPEHYEDVFDRDHQNQAPDDQGQDAHQILSRGWCREGAGIDIERTGADITIYHADRLVGKPEKHSTFEDLSRMISGVTATL